MSTIQDTDILLVNRGGTDYKTTAEDLYEYFNPKMPWEKYLGWFHVKNATETITLYVGWNSGFFHAWDIDGSNERMISSFGPGDELIVASDDPNCHRLFEKNYTGTWDFGPLTNTSRYLGMEFTFSQCKEFDGDVQYMDVGSAYTFGDAFKACEKFTGKGIEKWRAPGLEWLTYTFAECPAFVGDISNLLSGGSMLRSCYKTFQGATKFNCDISSWDVGGVDTFERMFDRCEEFNQDLNPWDTHSAIKMYKMFQDAKSFNQDLTGWCVPKIESEGDFRYGSAMPTDGSKDPCWGHCPRGENGTVDPCPTEPWEGFIGIYHVIIDDPDDISVSGQYKIWNKDTWAVVDRIRDPGEYIIAGAATRFKLSAGNWQFGPLTDTSKVTSMGEMFQSTYAFNSDLSMFDTSRVTNMEEMFQGAQAFNSNISNWNVSRVTDMVKMFNDAPAFNQDISGWDVSNVTEILNIFDGAVKFNQDISSWKLSSVTNMAGMFSHTEAFNQDISGWDVSKVTNMDNVFGGAIAFNQDIRNWDVSNVENMSSMFHYAKAFNLDLTGWCVPKVKRWYFFSAESGMPADGSYDPKWGTCP